MSTSYGVPMSEEIIVRLPPTSGPLAFPEASLTMRLVRSISSVGFFGGVSSAPAGAAVITTRRKLSSVYE